MKRLSDQIGVVAMVLVVTYLLSARCAVAVDSATVKALFADPPREYSTGPLWTWNDMLTEEQIVTTLRDLAGQRVRQVWVHPRPGLMTPYLSDDWFRLWKTALREAEQLDMNVWIYDENSYPSGFAGGLVPDAMPESRGRGLFFREETRPVKLGEGVLGVYRLAEDKFENVTVQLREGATLPRSRYLVAYVKRAEDSPWYAGKCYVDLLYPGVTEKFLDITLEAYRREVGEQFGKRIPGVFTDEPQLRPSGGLPWTDHIPAEFKRRWGYSLIECLPSLTKPVGDWKRVRHNYYQVILEQFIEHWGKPYFEYCQQHGLELTGHYWEHEWPNANGVPDNMAMAAWQQRPGIDVLFNNYSEGTHAQFGNVRAVREIASIANQFGRRTLSETYAGTGWENRFEDTKRIADWQFALGLNTLNECLSFVTIRGVRKGDYPQSLSYHNPWWEAYHLLANYFTRLSAALSQGDEVNSILILEPTTTAWMYQGESHLEQIGTRFQQLVTDLTKAQVSYDLGCENVLADHGSIVEARLKVGRREYTTLVLPPFCENVNAATMDLLEQYVKQGGEVLCCGPPPAMVDGQASKRGKALAQAANWKRFDVARLETVLRNHATDGFSVSGDPESQGILLHHRRRFEDGDLVFLVNTSLDQSSSGAVHSLAKGVERWDPETGKIHAHPFEKAEHGVRVPFDLPPCGSLLLFLSRTERDPAPPRPAKIALIPPTGPLAVRRVEPNVLTLDYMDVSAGGESRRSLYGRRAAAFVFSKHGFDRNPWFHAFQFRDELISKRFDADSGFTATYRFAIRQQVPKTLEVVIERPDLYTIRCNGKPITPTPGAWWLDRAFGRLDISKAAEVGENAITIHASPFTMYHELEPAYVLGDFSLKSADAGFVITPAKPLELGDWNTQGMPFYGSGVSYECAFEVAAPQGQYYVRLLDWYGSVAKIMVNGKLAGYIGYRPWRRNVTKWMQPGSNTIEVVVIGTLKNTLGPHHAGSVLGTMGPHHFEIAPEQGPPPGADYCTVGYGLRKPFVLEQAMR